MSFWSRSRMRRSLKVLQPKYWLILLWSSRAMLELSGAWALAMSPPKKGR